MHLSPTSKLGYLSFNPFRRSDNILTPCMYSMISFTIKGIKDERMSAEEMDGRRKENMAYEYLCHLEEAKMWVLIYMFVRVYVPKHIGAWEMWGRKRLINENVREFPAKLSVWQICSIMKSNVWEISALNNYIANGLSHW